MNTILHIRSGADLQGSVTRSTGQHLVDELKARDATARVTHRDLVADPVPHVGVPFVASMFSEDTEQPALTLSDRLIGELFASDTLVLEAPMYNFSIPSVVKAWIDHVVRARKTFRITEAGVEGLLKGKRGYLVLGSGGVYSDGHMRSLDFQEPYLRAMLGFIGLTDLETIRIEGLFLGRDEALARATQRIGELLTRRS